jgi:hypothetical protein
MLTATPAPIQTVATDTVPLMIGVRPRAQTIEKPSRFAWATLKRLNLPVDPSGAPPLPVTRSDRPESRGNRDHVILQTEISVHPNQKPSPSPSENLDGKYRRSVAKSEPWYCTLNNSVDMISIGVIRPIDKDGSDRPRIRDFCSETVRSEQLAIV